MWNVRTVGSVSWWVLLSVDQTTTGLTAAFNECLQMAQQTAKLYYYCVVYSHLVS